ncbi:MAG: S1C family serine protease [Phycisphaeraceae bacterium]
MTKLFGLILLMLTMLIPLMSCSEPSRAANGQADASSVFDRVYPATATVLRDGQIAGAGAFVSQSGHFLTAAHVVHNPTDRIELLLTDGRVVTAKTLASDLGHDMAILKIELEGAPGFRPLELAETLPPPGSRLYLVAAPSMLKETLLTGTSARNRLGFNFLGDRKCYTHTLLIAADAMPGSSGGCWMNENGQIVGVQTAVLGDGKASHGLAMIAPASAAKRLLKQKRDQPTPTLGGEFVGLRTQGYGFNKRFPDGAAGVALHNAFEGGPVAKAGIPKDHLITHVDGVAVADADAFLTQVRLRSPGDMLRLTVVSPDKHQTKEYDVKAAALTWQ